MSLPPEIISLRLSNRLHISVYATTDIVILALFTVETLCCINILKHFLYLPEIHPKTKYCPRALRFLCTSEIHGKFLILSLCTSYSLHVALYQEFIQPCFSSAVYLGIFYLRKCIFIYHILMFDFFSFSDVYVAVQAL